MLSSRGGRADESRFRFFLPKIDGAYAQNCTANRWSGLSFLDSRFRGNDGWGAALLRLPDENRGPRPFPASAVSVVGVGLGVDALSLRVGGGVDSGFRRNDGGWAAGEFGIGSAGCGIGWRGREGAWFPALAGMTGGGTAGEFGIGSAGCGIGWRRELGVGSGFRGNDGSEFPGRGKLEAVRFAD